MFISLKENERALVYNIPCILMNWVYNIKWKTTFLLLSKVLVFKEEQIMNFNSLWLLTTKCHNKQTPDTFRDLILFSLLNDLWALKMIIIHIGSHISREISWMRFSFPCSIHNIQSLENLNINSMHNKKIAYGCNYDWKYFLKAYNHS